MEEQTQSLNRQLRELTQKHQVCKGMFLEKL